MADSREAAALADLAALKLEEGDTAGAEELFRQALQQREQDGGAAALAPAVPDAEDDWEAWDEASVPVVQPAGTQQQQDGPADSWETSAPVPPRPRGASNGSSRASSRVAAAQAGAAERSRGSAADDDGEGEGEEEAGPVQYGGGHVLEFYDLTPAVRTQHLEAFLERHAVGHSAPPTLRWVDDYHAAVVCSDPAAARQLLAAAQAAGAAAEFRLRGYADAGSGTRKLAASELLPPKPRPKTSAAVARRLIGGALNLKLRDRDAEQQLRAQRTQKRQDQEQRQKALDEAWDR